jgi:POT family proton-dependent oligopeptide transporter
MAVDTFVFYIGIGFFNGRVMAFKPNMTSIISYAYEKHPEKRWSLFLYYGC